MHPALSLPRKSQEAGSTNTAALCRVAELSAKAGMQVIKSHGPGAADDMESEIRM